MKFHRINIESADWRRLDSFADRTVFQTRAWVQFVAEAQNADPVLAELRAGSEVVGYFTGLTFSKFGMKVLGSSFPGWTTPYMGFNLNPGIARRDALVALEKFAWDDLKCLHVEVSDPHFTFEDGEAAGFKAEYYASYRTDLTRSEEELFNGMESACRRCVRKAEKSGLRSKRRTIWPLPTSITSNSRTFSPTIAGPTYSVERVRPWYAILSQWQHPAASRARSGREVHCHGNLSRLQPDCRVLGQCEFPRLPEPAPE